MVTSFWVSVLFHTSACSMSECAHQLRPRSLCRSTRTRHLGGNLQDRVKKNCMASNRVSVQKTKTRDRPFKRSLRQICLPPSSTSDAVVSAVLQTSNYFCPETLRPLLLLDVNHISVHSDADSSKCPSKQNSAKHLLETPGLV